MAGSQQELALGRRGPARARIDGREPAGADRGGAARVRVDGTPGWASVVVAEGIETDRYVGVLLQLRDRAQHDIGVGEVVGGAHAAEHADHPSGTRGARHGEVGCRIADDGHAGRLGLQGLA